MRTRTDYANGLQFSPDGKRLIVAAGRDDLWWFDPAAGKTQFHHEYPVRNIKCGRLLDDGQLVLLHSRGVGDKTSYFVMRFDPATGKVVSDEAINVGDVTEAEFDTRATAVVVVRDKTVAVYDTKTGEQRWSQRWDTKLECCPKFVAHDANIVVLGPNSKLTLHDAKTGRVASKLEGTSNIPDASEVFNTVVESPDGRFLAAAASADWAYIWDAKSGKILHRLREHRKPIGFDTHGRVFIAGTTETASIMNAATGKHECVFSLPWPDKAHLSPDGKRLVLVLQDAILVYDVPAAGPPTLAATAPDLPGLPDQLRFDPDGTLVGRLPGWNGWAVWTDRKPPTHLLPGGKGPPVGLSADRTWSLVLGNNEFTVFGPAGVTATRSLEVNLSPPAMSLSGDGRTVVTTHDEGLMRFDGPAGKGTVVRSRFKDRGAGTAAVISADGRTAATEGYDPVTDARYVEVFSLVTNKPVREVPIRGPLDRMAISPDGRRVAAAFVTNSPQSNLEKNLLVFDPETGHELLKLGPMPKGEDLRLAMSPDGRTAAWHANGELRIYELVGGQVRAKLPTPKNDLHGIALAADGRTLAAAPGWPVILWDLAGETKLTPLAAANEWADTWAAFARPDATIAYLAARRMVLTPTDAVAFFKSKLAPVAPPELGKWIAKLDAPAFADRQEAAKQLRAFGELAIPELRRTLDTTDSAEVRQRIEGLLTASRKPTPEAIRAARAVEALEWLGTADAKTLLKALAAGAEGSRQTQEAVAALGRMK